MRTTFAAGIVVTLIGFALNAAPAAAQLAPSGAHGGQAGSGAWEDRSGELPGISDGTDVLLIGAAVAVGAFVLWRVLRSDPGANEEGDDSGTGASFAVTGGAPAGSGGSVPGPALGIRTAGVRSTDCRVDPLPCLGLARARGLGLR